MSDLLKRIESPKDLHKLSDDEVETLLDLLTDQVREVTMP